MPLTRTFRETIRARADRDPLFRQALLTESIQLLLDGDATTSRALLRDYVNATVGFAALGKQVNKSPKSLMHMLGPRGNPRTDNLMAVISALQKHEGVTLHVTAE